MLFPQESGKYDANFNAHAVSVDYADSVLLAVVDHADADCC